MTKSLDARTGLTRWTAESDTQSRADFDHDNETASAVFVMYVQDVRAARPAAGKEGRYFWAEDERAAYYDDGLAWNRVGDIDVIPSATNGGDVPAGPKVHIFGDLTLGTDSSGRASYTYPTAFATRSIAVLVTGVGVSVRLDGTTGFGARGHGTSGFAIGGGPVSGSVTFSFHAIGY